MSELIAAIDIPAPTRRLLTDLSFPISESLLVERLLEDGDVHDLRWLFASRSKARIADLLSARRLSARSWSFWSLLLIGPDAPLSKPTPRNSELWPY